MMKHIKTTPVGIINGVEFNLMIGAYGMNEEKSRKLCERGAIRHFHVSFFHD
jgi:hypothetical protein